MKIGVMGIGYVGLPLAVAFAEQGHDVVGVDVDARKVEALTRGDSYIEDIPSPRLQAVAERFEAMSNDRVARHAGQRGHERDATGVVLERRVVETLLGGPTLG